LRALDKFKDAHLPAAAKIASESKSRRCAPRAADRHAAFARRRRASARWRDRQRQHRGAENRLQALGELTDPAADTVFAAQLAKLAAGEVKPALHSNS